MSTINYALLALIAGMATLSPFSISENKTPSHSRLALEEIPIVTTSADLTSLNENSGTVTITATLSTTTDVDDVIIDFSASGTASLNTDYTMSSNSITILSGNTTGTITINGIDDDIDETPTGDETIIISVVSIQDGIDATSPINLTLLDDDVTPGFELDRINIDEGESGTIYARIPNSYPTSSDNISFTATITAETTATYSSDYTGDTTFTFTIPAGQRVSSNAITINAIEDDIYEGGPYESLFFEASNPTNVDISYWNSIYDSNYSSIFSSEADFGECFNAGIPYYEKTIRGDQLGFMVNCQCTYIFSGTNCSQINGSSPYPQINLSISNAVVGEDVGTLTVTATNTGPLAGYRIIINLGFGGTATLNTDYTHSSNQIIIPKGASTGSLTLTINEDSVNEDVESIVISKTSTYIGTYLNHPYFDHTNSTNSITTRIYDAGGPPQLNYSFANDSISEAGTSNILTLSLDAPLLNNYDLNFSLGGTAAITDDYTSADYYLPTRFGPGGYRVTIPAGQTSVTSTISTVQDALYENDPLETVTIQYISTTSILDFSDSSGVQTFHIIDDECDNDGLGITASISEESCSAGEGNDDGEINISISGGSSPYQVNWSTGSTDTDINGLSANTYTVTVTDDNNCITSLTNEITVTCPEILDETSGCNSYSISSVSDNQWYDIKSGDGIIMSINPNGNILGTVTVEMLDLGENVGTTNGGNNYLPRYWNLSCSGGVDCPVSGNFPQGDVSVKFYFLDEELTVLNQALGSVLSRSTLSLAHYDGPNEDCDPSNNNYSTGQEYILTPTAESAYNFSGQSGHIVQFDFPSFSEAGITNGSSLPVEWLSFSGVQQKRNILLNWSTINDANAAYFEIQRSENGRLWESIGTHQILETEIDAQYYKWLDDQAKEGNNYYRIKQFDNDGSFNYSKIIEVKYKDNSDFRVVGLFPNPSETGSINLKLSSKKEGVANITFFNIADKRSIQHKTFEVKSGAQVIKFDLQFLPPGTYFAKLEHNKEVQILKFILM